MRYALFWDDMQCRVAIPYRRFGAAYRPHFHGSRSPWNNLYCVISQKRAHFDIRNTAGSRNVQTSNRTNTGQGADLFEPDNGVFFPPRKKQITSYPGARISTSKEGTCSTELTYPPFLFIFIVAPCISKIHLVSHQLMHYYSIY